MIGPFELQVPDGIRFAAYDDVREPGPRLAGDVRELAADDQPPAPSAATARTAPSTPGHAVSRTPEPSNRSQCPERIASRSKRPTHTARCRRPTANGLPPNVPISGIHPPAGNAATCARAEPAATNKPATTSRADMNRGRRRGRPIAQRAGVDEASPNHPTNHSKVNRVSPRPRRAAPGPSDDPPAYMALLIATGDCAKAPSSAPEHITLPVQSSFANGVSRRFRYFVGQRSFPSAEYAGLLPIGRPRLPIPATISTLRLPNAA